MIIIPALQEPSSSFTRYHFEPGSLSLHRDWEMWDTHVRMMLAYYANTAYQDLAAWAKYRRDYRLYRHVRPIYNPTNRLVNFYAGAVYPGRLTNDPARLPDGTRNAMPLDPATTSPALSAAFVQLWQWSNWQSNKSVMVRYGATVGSVLVEIVDDVPRQKVYFEVTNPRKVKGLVLDAAGNVKAYSFEYDVYDEIEKRSYTYRKDVTTRTISYFKDGSPYARPGIPAVSANPYGFCPAVWVKHIDIGHIFGVPAIYGSIPKIDEVNSVASHINDHIHKVVEAGKILWGGDSVQDISLTADQSVFTTGNLENLRVLIGEVGGSASDLAGDLGLDKALQIIQEGVHEFERDHPETTIWTKLRDMQVVSGVAALRLMGDVTAIVDEVSANYDMQVVKLHQMAVAIGGMRLAAGDWPFPTPQQLAFQGFGLHSYTEGTLNFDIMPRPLITSTALELLEVDRARVALNMERAAASAPADLEQQLLNQPTTGDNEIAA